MPRFFVPNISFAIDSPISLPAQAVHHAMRVLRLKDGAEVEVFDGNGKSAKGKIHFGKDKAVVSLETILPEQEEHLKIIVLQALVSNEKMDWIVEKACELGTSKLLIYPPERTDIKISGDKIDRKLERWRRIAIASCCQCGRNQLLQIGYCQSLQNALENGQGLKILLNPSEELGAESLPKQLEAVTFLIGPEGGLAQREIASALAAGFEAMSLGKLILRTETAGIVAAAFAQTLWGSYRATELTP